jgi:cell division septum initiation protein DivIVA
MADQTKDLLARLTDLSEGAIQRISEAPGAEKAYQALKALGERVDDLQRRTRGFEEIEKRLTALEKKVDGLAKPKAARKTSSARSTRARTTKAAAAPKTPEPKLP